MIKKVLASLLVLSIISTSLASCDDKLKDNSSVNDSSSIVSTTTTAVITTTTTTKPVTKPTTTTVPEVTYPVGEEIFICGVAKNFNSNKTFVINADNKNWTIDCHSVYNFSKLQKLIKNKEVKIICDVTGKSSVTFKSVEVNDKTYNIQSFKKSVVTTTTVPQTVIVTNPPEITVTNPPEEIIDNSGEINYYRSLINDLNNDILNCQYNVSNEKINISRYELTLNSYKSSLSSAKNKLTQAKNTQIRYYSGGGWVTGTDANAIAEAQREVSYWNNIISECENLIQSSQNDIDYWNNQIESDKAQIQEYQNYINSLQ